MTDTDRTDANSNSLSHIRIDPLDQQLAASMRGEHEEAWRLAQLLEKERPNDNRAAFNRGWHYLHRGDLQKGLELTERGRLEKVYGSLPLKTNKPMWTGSQSLVGKTILLRGEGGFGDEIINIRFAQGLQKLGATVIASASEGIVPLLKRSTAVTDVIDRNKELSAHFDYWVPAMAAPLYLKHTYQTIPNDPYVCADKTLTTLWSNIISGKGLKVGIRWSGNPKFEHEQNRRFPAEFMFGLANLPNTTFFSLQRDNDLRDLPANIVDLQNLITTWEDTAAAIANLDLVITSCTSVAHLAASMGKETWIVVPILPYYIWALPGETSPWYKTVRLFRQEVYGSWDEPFVKIKNELAKKLQLDPKQLYMQGDAQKTKTILTTTGTTIAPAPVATTPLLRQQKNTLHFVAGLPRSGSTALMTLLAQNPRIYSAPISGLSGIFGGIYANWDKSEFHQELPNPDAKKRALRALLEHYHYTDRPLIIDKDRQWMSFFALLEEVLERPVKMIIPVRPIAEVVASFESLRQKQPLELTNSDDALGPSSTIESRAAYFADAKGPLGMAYNALKDSVTQGYLDRMLFVDYNKLTSAPKAQLKRVYDFLGEPNFEHDFTNIKEVVKGDSRPHKFVGLHDVRAEFKKTSRSAREVLGDVYGKYDQPEPWSQWT